MNARSTSPVAPKRFLARTSQMMPWPRRPPLPSSHSEKEDDVSVLLNEAECTQAGEPEQIVDAALNLAGELRRDDREDAWVLRHGLDLFQDFGHEHGENHAARTIPPTASAGSAAKQRSG